MSLDQKPIGSPYTASNTAAEVGAGVDLNGRTVVVTGGYAGIGREAVRVLLGAGARVIVPARDLDKARRNLADLPAAEIAEMDLMDPASIDAFADAFLAENGKLDILVDNAGTMAAPLSRDGRGFESQFSTNVLGHYHLTARLWPALVAAGKARVVMLSSANHRADVTELLRDPNFDATPYDPWQAYARSKAAIILLAVALDSIGKKSGVRAFAVHPGGIFETDLARHMDPAIAKAHGMIDDDGKPIIDPAKGWKDVPQGASTTVWAATSPLLQGLGGVYLTDNDVGVQDTEDGGALSNGVAPSANDPVNAGRLFEICRQLTGVRLDARLPD